MVRLLLVLIPLLLAPGAASAAPCDGWGVGDLALADAAEVAFVGRFLRERRGALTYRVTRAITGRVRRGQKITVRTGCASRPSGREHLVFAGPGKRVLAGRDGLRRAQPARVAALTAWHGAKDDGARTATLLRLYHEHQDPFALELLVDAPRLLAHLDVAARDALIRDIGRAPWGVVEPLALARLGRPTAVGLLTLADRRCTDAAFDTPCTRAIPEALAYLRTPAPKGDAAALAEIMRSAEDRRARLRALDACEEVRGARYDGAPEVFGFTGRLLALPKDFPARGQRGWEEAARWCEGAAR